MRNNQTARRAAAALCACVALLRMPVGSAAPARATQDLSGTWVGVYEAYPNLVQLSLQLPKGDGSSRYMASAPMHIGPLVQSRISQGVPMGTVQVAVTYDSAARTLTITPGADAYRTMGVQIPSLSGVLDEDNQVAGGILAGARSDTSPYFVLGRSEEAQDKFLRSLSESASPGGRAPTVLGFNLGNLGGGANIGKMVEWAGRVNAEYPNLDPWNTALGSMYPMARNLFRDEYFRPYFGKRFDDMSMGELQRISVQLRSLPAPRDHSPDQKPAETLHALQNTFLPQPIGFMVQDYRLSEIAMRAMAGWRAQSAKRIETSPVGAESWAPIVAAEAAEKALFGAFFPSEHQGFATTLANTRSRLATPLLAQQVDEVLKSSTSYADVPKLGSTMTALTASTAGSSPEPSITTLSPYVAEDARRSLITQLGTRQAALAAAEVKSEVASARGTEGLHQLLATDQELRQQLKTAGNTSEVQTEIFASLKQAVSALDASQAAIESKDYQTFAGQAAGLPALIEAKRREETLKSTYGEQLNAPEFAAFNEERRQFREALLTQNTKTLSDSILAAGNVPAVDSIIDKYVASSDLNSSAAKALAQAAQQRKSILAPFADLPGADYLNAIYGGSLAEVRALDQEYLARIRAFMDQALASLPMLRGVFDTRSASLITPVMNAYLLDYGRIYSKCLRPDAVEFKITDTLRNSYGMLLNSSERYYQVNKEFAQAFNEVGTNNPAAGAIADLLMNNGNITKIALGTEQLMGRYPCTDPRMKRFEANLLSLYTQIN